VLPHPAIAHATDATSAMPQAVDSFAIANPPSSATGEATWKVFIPLVMPG
jgi:hypothetical protein